jgi:RNA polymerase sigma-70 factor (ECF subfamily)
MDRFQYDKKKGRFRAYLRASVVRAMGRRASKRAKQETPLDPQALDTFTDDDTHADEQWEREWRLHRLRWALRSISAEFEPKTLEAFCLHVLANRSVTDTAEHLGLSTASVYQAKSRILKRLRERISTLDTDEENWPE